MIDHRPRYHLRPARGWTNDPIGPVHWRGRYHLFHQANPEGGFWHRPHWGHFVSADLVRWEELPLALSPSPDGPDADGCYSGCVVAQDGTATALYTGACGPDGFDQQQVTCLATSTDDDLVTWQKHPAAVTMPPPDLDLLGFRDPYVWRHGDHWLQLVGSGIADVGGAVFLYRSTDLHSWEQVGPLLIGDRSAVDPLWTGAMWECPALVSIDGGDVLVLSVHDGGRTHHPVVLDGQFDGQRFRPDRGVRMDLGPDYYAPCVLADPAGRHVCWGWSWEALTPTAQREAGWAGVLSLPRLLTRRPDGLGVEPLPELVALRRGRRRLDAVPPAGGAAASGPVRASSGGSRTTGDGDDWRAAGGDGDSIELAVTFPPRPGTVGVRVLCSPDGAEQTVIAYDRDRDVLTLDRERASHDPAALGGVHGGPVDLDGEALELRVFVDRSIIEVYANGRVALTSRVYPTRHDSTGVEVFASGDTPAPEALAIWDLDAVVGPQAR